MIYVKTDEKVINELKKLGFNDRQIKKLDENFIILNQAKKVKLEEDNRLENIILKFEAFNNKKPSETTILHFTEAEMKKKSLREMLEDWMEQKKGNQSYFKGIYSIRYRGRIIQKIVGY